MEGKLEAFSDGENRQQKVQFKVKWDVQIITSLVQPPTMISKEKESVTNLLKFDALLKITNQIGIVDFTRTILTNWTSYK